MINYFVTHPFIDFLIAMDVISFVFVFFTYASIAAQIKREHPYLHMWMKRCYKLAMVERVRTWFMTIIICMIPFFNIVWLLVHVFGYEKLYEGCVTKLEIKRSAAYDQKQEDIEW